MDHVPEAQHVNKRNKLLSGPLWPPQWWRWMELKLLIK